MLSDLRIRLRALFRRADVERELDDELRFHLERETEKHMRAGMSRADAERRARLDFGGVERIKDDARDARGISALERIAQDLRYGWRGLRTRPGFTLGVIVTLGLGIGANTALFGVVDRLMFRAPRYLADADRVHRVYLAWTSDGSERVERTLEYTRFVDLTRAQSFDKTAVAAYRQLAVGTGEATREMTVAIVSASLFDLFHVRPVLGRFLTASDDHTPRGSDAAVLGYGFWQSAYGGRPDAIGARIYIGSAVYTIVGVAPPDFVGVTDGNTPAAFIPVTTFAGIRNDSYYRNYHWGWLEMFARRKADVDPVQASADLTQAYRRSWLTEREQDPIAPLEAARPHVVIGPVQLSRGPEASQDSRVLGWVMGVALIVLLVASANVANLLLARAVQRRREIALRMALGVSRMRLLQQLLTESVLLAALGGAVGLALAHWGGRSLRLLFVQTEDASGVVNDARTLVFVLAATLGVAVVTGLAPVLHAMRGDVADALKAGARSGTHRRSRLRGTLLIFQGALSVVLLVGAGLFVRSLHNVRSLRLGFDVSPVVYVGVNLRGTQLSEPEQYALQERLLQTMRTTPGIASASLTVSVPFWSNEGRGAPFVPGRDSTAKLGQFLLQAGSPSYFETTGTRIVRGRGFLDTDTRTSPRVAVLSERMAAALWPSEDALGKVFRLGSDTEPFITVVGIAEDMHARLLRDDREYWYYLPITQYGGPTPYLFARVAASARAEDYVEVLRRRLQQQMPGVAYVSAMPLRALVAPQQRAWDFGAKMFVAFGALALVLAAIGLYSVIAYAVAQRTHELGVRIALGASTADVVRLIVAQGLAFAVAGLAIGSAIAFWAGRFVEPLLFAQSARDPLIFGAVGGVLVAVAVLATMRPAVRATRVDPTEALRSD